MFFGVMGSIAIISGTFYGFYAAVWTASEVFMENPSVHTLAAEKEIGSYITDFTAAQERLDSLVTDLGGKNHLTEQEAKDAYHLLSEVDKVMQKNPPALSDLTSYYDEQKEIIEAFLSEMTSGGFGSQYIVRLDAHIAEYDILTKQRTDVLIHALKKAGIPYELKDTGEIIYQFSSGHVSN